MKSEGALFSVPPERGVVFAVDQASRHARALWSIIGIVLALILLSGPAAFGADVPVGFAETVVPGPSNGNWTEAVGLTFSINGRMWVWERGGRVWIRDTNQVAFALLLNISDEVARGIRFAFSAPFVMETQFPDGSANNQRFCSE